MYPYSDNNPISRIDFNGANYFNYNYSAYQHEFFNYTANVSESFNNGIERIARLTFEKLQNNGLLISATGAGVFVAGGPLAPVGAKLFVAGGIISGIGAIGEGLTDYIVYNDPNGLIRVLSFEAVNYALGKTLSILKATPKEKITSEFILQIFNESIENYER